MQRQNERCEDVMKVERVNDERKGDVKRERIWDNLIVLSDPGRFSPGLG